MKKKNKILILFYKPRSIYGKAIAWYNRAEYSHVAHVIGATLFESTATEGVISRPYVEWLEDADKKNIVCY